MADLYTTHPPEWDGHPPQMHAADFAVWRTFLARRGREWRAYAYDVELHGGATPIVDSAPEMAKMWARSIAKRADVIAQRASGHTLIEVRRNAGWSTIGQLLTYRRMFPLDYPAEPLEAALIVCETIDPDARETARGLGLDIWTTAD